MIAAPARITPSMVRMPAEEFRTDFSPIIADLSNFSLEPLLYLLKESSWQRQVSTNHLKIMALSLDCSWRWYSSSGGSDDESCEENSISHSTTLHLDHGKGFVLYHEASFSLLCQKTNNCLRITGSKLNKQKMHKEIDHFTVVTCYRGGMQVPETGF